MAFVFGHGYSVTSSEFTIKDSNHSKSLLLLNFNLVIVMNDNKSYGSTTQLWY